MFELLHDFQIYKTKIAIPDYLLEGVYELKKIDDGTPKTNNGGWHSKTFTPYKDNYNGRYKWTKTFIDDITAVVNTKWNDVKFNRAWFNLSPSGSTNKWHDHGSHPVVGVLYIEVPDNSGEIEFRKDKDYFSYLPTKGDFLIFPGPLEHAVKAGTNTTDRLSLAINFS